jgi:hypothetical protein
MFESLSLLTLSLAPVIVFLAGGVILGLLEAMLKTLSLSLPMPVSRSK